jgi:phosphatidylglycerol:prolipoprotein diacylglycerol transferase
VHPIAFKLGTLTVTWYGIMVATGFLAGLWTAGRRGLRQGVSPEQVHDLGLSLMIGSIAGARILYVITFWRDQFAAHPFPEVFEVWHGGLVYYGGLIGACLAGIIHMRLKRMPLWKMADVLAPSVALGYAFGRIGCLMNGCCYGSACSLPWAITFPGAPENGPGGVPRHPTQIYDSLLSLCLYGFLAWLYRRKKFDGQVFATYLVCYAVSRSFVELFRGDYPVYQRGLHGLATPAQMVSIFILLTGVALFLFLRRSLNTTLPKP